MRNCVKQCYLSSFDVNCLNIKQTEAKQPEHNFRHLIETSKI